jgi:hypothetical protein
LNVNELRQQAQSNPCFKSVNVASNGINDQTPHLPSEIFLLSNLRELHITNNSFRGSIPTEIGLLSDLASLQLGGNQLTGRIPSELGQISTLRALVLHGNALNGTIPTELGQLSTLERLYLHSNDLTGTIPSELGLLSTLEDLSLNDNALTGTLPIELGHLSRHVILSDLFVKYKVSSHALQDPSSPQYKALEWMVEKDNTELQSTVPDDDIVERFALVLLYFATGGESWSDQAGFLSPMNNVCSWYSFVDGTKGVECNDEGSVVILDLCKFHKPST